MWLRLDAGACDFMEIYRKRIDFARAEHTPAYFQCAHISRTNTKCGMPRTARATDAASAAAAAAAAAMLHYANYAQNRTIVCTNESIFSVRLYALYLINARARDAEGAHV